MTTSLNPRDAADSGPLAAHAVGDFWFAPVDPTGLGVMRILCGLLVFYNTLVYSYDFFSYVGPNSWLDVPTQNYLRKECPISVPPNNWTDPVRVEKFGASIWSIYYHVHDPFWVVVIHVSILAVLLLYTAGVWTRVTSVLAWFGAMQYVQRLATHLYGQDTMQIILLLYLMIGNSGAALSVDRWLDVRRSRRELDRGMKMPLKPSWSANFALRLVQVHFCIIYLVSGTSKLLGSAWWNGTALWLCLANYNFAPMRVGLYDQALIFLCQHRPLWEMCLTSGVVFTLFTEIGLPFLVWQRRWRPFMVSCSVLLHLGIGLVMGLSVFSLMMLVMVLAFAPPEVMRVFADELRARGRGWFKVGAAPPAAMKEPLILSRI